MNEQDNLGEGGYDFASAELDYRAGGYSVNALSIKYNIPETTLRRYAKQNGWVKGSVEAKRALVREAMAGVSGEHLADDPANFAVRQLQLDAAVQDVADMNKGLSVARRCMDKLLSMVDQVDHPKEVKLIVEANKLAVETIRKIRSLDADEVAEDPVAGAVSDGFAELREAFKRRLATPYQSGQDGPGPDDVA